jgi:beta-aspartyl-peptidase (threonine type)
MPSRTPDRPRLKRFVALFAWLLLVPVAVALAVPGPGLAGWFTKPRPQPQPQPQPQAPWSCNQPALQVAPMLPPQAPDTAATEAADTAIRQVLEDQVQAWNKGDLDTFMKGYWSSPDLTFFSGNTKTRGWQATLERYVKRYRSEGREMGKLTFSEIEIDVLGPDSALVRGRWQLETSKEKPNGLFTLIFKHKPEGWRIVHDHTSNQ